MSEVFALIPAKGQSSRIPRKNLRELDGRTLLEWTVRAAKACPVITRTYVSTEDAAVARAALELGALVIDRPDELARDPAEAQDVAVHAVETWGEEGATPDAVVMLLPTSPFRTWTNINDAYWWHVRTGKTVVSTSPRPEARHKWVCEQPHGLQPCAPEGARPQELNGAIWVDTPDRILAHGGYQVAGAMAHPLSRIEGLDIDRETDWAAAEAYVRRGWVSCV